jgi:ATP adenylyltransferase
MKKTDALLADIWPQERDIFVRPERLKYVRKIVKPKGCVFCKALESKKRSEVGLLYQSKNAMVVLNKYPYNNGHLLLLPARHVGSIEDLKPKEWSEIHGVLKEAVSILKDAYSCSGLNVGLNLGKAAGAGIPDHLHYHIIPRWVGDTNFFPLIAETKVVVETLQTSFKKLEKKFKALEGKFK